LRENQRALWGSALTLFSSLVTKYTLSQISVSSLECVVLEVPALISDQDMYIIQQAMKFAKEVVVKFPLAIGSSLSAVINACVELNSSLLVGRSLEFAMELFVVIVQSSIQQKPDFMTLMNRLIKPIRSKKPTRQVCHSTAFILARSAKANNDSKTTAALVKTLTHFAESADEDESTHIFALYALGEMGRVYPEAFVDSSPETIIMKYFDSSTDEVKASASYAFGALASGNVSKYLPVLLRKIESNPYYLYALKEVITSRVEFEFSVNEIDGIWAVLLNHSKAQEESTCNVVAECMGKLCKIEPTKFLPQLITISKNENPLERVIAVTAVRFMLSSNADQHLHDNLAQLLSAIDDEDLQVKKAAIMTINSTSHNKPRWVKELLPTLLPSLYRETAIRRELIREIESGQFKHSVDDGLDLRKAAYECMYTLIDQCLEKIDVFEFLDYVERGLKDQHDIALLNLLMITRLAGLPQMIQRIDGISDLIMPLLQLKACPNWVKRESDKLDELKRSTVRTVVLLRQVPDLQRNGKLNQVYDFIKADRVLQLMIKDG